jgi:predicted metalloprotease
MLRPLAACLLAAGALFAAGCGDDDSSDSGSTSETSAKALTDVEPRASKPNIAGGNAPIEELMSNAAGDASNYFNDVFTNSNLTYEAPDVQVVAQQTDSCNGPFDPSSMSISLCAAEGGSTIYLGGPRLDQIRTDKGDGAAVFLAGFSVAADANDQLSGRPIANGEQADGAFYQTAACFTGAWIRNLADRTILEAGDDQEILGLAAEFIDQDPNVGPAAVQNGYQNGAGACQGGGGGDQGGGSDEPAPSPTG